MINKENQMSKPGQEAGQSRDSVGQPPETVVSVPWRPRADDKRAILVNERATVFDRPAVLPEPVDAPEVQTALGPIPTTWTWDLVHCRFLAVHAMAASLPRLMVPATYRSFLGSLQPQESAKRHRVLTDEDTKRFDWTMSRIDAWPDIDRIIIKGYMSGHSLDDISAATVAFARRYGDKGLARSSVYKRYRTDTAIMAAEWTDIGEPIDIDTRECWLNKGRLKATNAE
jgi:hypothetical protein